MLYTDRISIIPTSQDEWGKITEGASVETKARIEDFNDLIKDQNGVEVMPQMLIILPKNVTIKYAYFVKVVSKQGIAFEQPDKKFSIKKIFHAGMHKPHHIEVYL